MTSTRTPGDLFEAWSPKRQPPLFIVNNFLTIIQTWAFCGAHLARLAAVQTQGNCSRVTATHFGVSIPQRPRHRPHSAALTLRLPVVFHKVFCQAQKTLWSQRCSLGLAITGLPAAICAPQGRVVGLSVRCQLRHKASLPGPTHVCAADSVVAACLRQTLNPKSHHGP